MDKRDQEIMHRILDQEAGEDEERSFARLMEADEEIRKEFAGLRNAVSALEKSSRREPPALFTTSVMHGLPKARPALLSRIRDFFFASHLLRWNMATALGAAAVIVLAVVVMRLPQEPAAEPSSTVRLTFYSPQAQMVSVAGAFPKWNADEMHGTGGMWSIELKLKPGAYSYSFIVDGKSWVSDPGAESYADDGFGSRNAVLRVTI
jgi:AMP-activated protein kinase-like protein